MKNKKVFKILLFFLTVIISIPIFSSGKNISNAQNLNKITLKENRNEFNDNFEIDSMIYNGDNMAYTLNYPIFENENLNKKIYLNIERIVNDFIIEFKGYIPETEDDKVYLALETDLGFLPKENLLFIRFYINRNYLTYPNPITSYESHIYNLSTFEEVNVNDIFDDYSRLLYIKSKDYFKNNYGITINEHSENYFDIAPKMENYQNIFIKNKFFEFVIFDYKKSKDVIIRTNLHEIKPFIKNNINKVEEISSEINNQITSEVYSEIQDKNNITESHTEITTIETLKETLKETTSKENYPNIKNVIANKTFIIPGEISLELSKIGEDIEKIKLKKIEEEKQKEAIKKNIDPNKPMIALTFDDGPNASVTNRILDVLEENNARATFFVVGRRLDKDSETLKRMHQLGNQIGNHTYNHKNLSQISSQQIHSEIDNINKKLEKYIGQEASIVRVPYGATNKDVLDGVKYPLIMWNVDTKDWKTRNKNSIISEVRKNAKDGNIILMHDLYTSTADACEVIIPELINQGFQLVTVEELMEYKGIELKPGEKYYNGIKN